MGWDQVLNAVWGNPNTPTSALEHNRCVAGCAVGVPGAQRVAQGMACALRCEPSWRRSSMPCACAHAINIAMQAARAQCWLAVAHSCAWWPRLHLVYMCTWCMHTQAVNVGHHQLEVSAAYTWSHGYQHLWAWVLPQPCAHSWHMWLPANNMRSQPSIASPGAMLCLHNVQGKGMKGVKAA